MEAEEPLLPPPTTSSTPSDADVEDPPAATTPRPEPSTSTSTSGAGTHLLHPEDGKHLQDERKATLHRARTAPALALLRALDPRSPDGIVPKLRSEEAGSVLWQASMLLLLYLALGIVAYSFNRHHFSGEETHPVVDSLYFCIVTLCTIGYGDITPLTPTAKALSCIFVLVGFGFLDILLSGAVNYVLDLQEGVVMEAARGGAGAIGYLFDAEKGRMRIRMKVGLALGVVVLCIGLGTLVLFLVEKMDWVDSFYLSVMSVTTVGYGDKAFKTLPGRLFASVWLLVSTLAVARSFLFLAEARIDKRHRRIAKWVLQRDMTVEDLMAADLNNTGFISKSEYVIFKLKEMGKIEDKDILQICNQFNKFDPNNSGKITLPNLLNGSGR
uniref:Putative calcium-activated outward-rectifying potassium channel 5, chloroplastic n=1 Tax=Anthurium amnicola TaxID=1678845 RepID=A0A1D1Y579_9ARAE